MSDTIHSDLGDFTLAADPTANMVMWVGKSNPKFTIPMILTCPSCNERHIDEGEFATKAHHTHACQGCGMVWRPAKVNTHGVWHLPGYKNERKLLP